MDARTATDKLVSDLEGGYSNSAIDRGGATKWGITHTEYDAYRTSKSLPTRDITQLTTDEMYEIYYYSYWLPAGGGKLSDGLDYAVFQAGVNDGVGTAVMMLQGLVGVTRDGIIGPQTLAAVNELDQAQVIRMFLEAQREHYAAIVARNPDQAGNLDGWYNRVQKVADFLSTYEKGIGGGLLLLVIGFLAYKTLK